MPTGGPTGGGGGAAAAYRPLNVRDALQYLDRVKQQFSAEFEGKFGETIRVSFELQDGGLQGLESQLLSSTAMGLEADVFAV